MTLVKGSKEAKDRMAVVRSFKETTVENDYTRISKMKGKWTEEMLNGLTLSQLRTMCKMHFEQMPTTKKGVINYMLKMQKK